MRRLLLAGLVLLAVGCYDYTLIVKMNPDGSGSLTLEMRIPTGEDDSITFEDFKHQLDTTSGWQTSTFAVDTVADTIIQLRVEGSFDTPLTLTKLSNCDFFYADSFSFAHENIPSGKRFHLYKSYSASLDSLGVSATTEDSDTSIAMEMTVIESNFDDFDPDAYTWHEELVLPGAIFAHNADERKGDTLIWKRRTWDVFKDGLIIEAVWEIAK